MNNMPKKEKELDLYKIVKRDKDTNAIVKSRIYETKDSFEKQVKKISTIDRKCYDIKYYTLYFTYGGDISWEEIKV